MAVPPPFKTARESPIHQPATPREPACFFCSSHQLRDHSMEGPARTNGRVCVYIAPSPTYVGYVRSRREETKICIQRDPTPRASPSTIPAHFDVPSLQSNDRSRAVRERRARQSGRNTTRTPRGGGGWRWLRRNPGRVVRLLFARGGGMWASCGLCKVWSARSRADDANASTMVCSTMGRKAASHRCAPLADVGPCAGGMTPTHAPRRPGMCVDTRHLRSL